jgi:hypothetical protein
MRNRQYCYIQYPRATIQCLSICTIFRTRGEIAGGILVAEKEIVAQKRGKEILAGDASSN